jgi:hypothetical protein
MQRWQSWSKTNLLDRQYTMVPQTLNKSQRDRQGKPRSPLGKTHQRHTQCLKLLLQDTVLLLDKEHNLSFQRLKRGGRLHSLSMLLLPAANIAPMDRMPDWRKPHCKMIQLDILNIFGLQK